MLSSVLDSNSTGDIGYQVVNYTNIDQLFGDLQDMDDLITAAHDRGVDICCPNYHKTI